MPPCGATGLGASVVGDDKGEERRLTGGGGWWRQSEIKLCSGHVLENATRVWRERPRKGRLGLPVPRPESYQKETSVGGRVRYNSTDDGRLDSGPPTRLSSLSHPPLCR